MMIIDFLKAHKLAVVAVGVGTIGAVKYISNKRAARNAAAQSAQDTRAMITSAPMTVAGMPVGGMGGEGLTASGTGAPFSLGTSDGLSSTSPAGIAAALSGGGNTTGSVAGNGMYDYLLKSLSVQTSSDLAMLTQKGANDQALATLYGLNDLNLAQNASVTFLGGQISKQGGSIDLTSNLKGSTSLKVSVNPTFDQTQTLLKQQQNKDIVSSLYSTIAGKSSPDSGGFAYWTAQLDSGKALDTVVSSFKSAVNQSAIVSQAVTAGNNSYNNSINGVSTSSASSTVSPSVFFVPEKYTGYLPSQTSGTVPVVNSGNGMNYVDTTFTGAPAPSPVVNNPMPQIPATVSPTVAAINSNNASMPYMPAGTTTPQALRQALANTVEP